MNDMLEMGNYGPYVWTCFGLALAIVVFIEWRARHRQKIMLKEIKLRIEAMDAKQ